MKRSLASLSNGKVHTFKSFGQIYQIYPSSKEKRALNKDWPIFFYALVHLNFMFIDMCGFKLRMRDRSISKWECVIGSGKNGRQELLCINRHIGRDSIGFQECELNALQT